jgi:3-hydroxyacyl-CoA dehydrogenase
MPSHSIAESEPLRVGVVGPGLMGLGITQALGAAGIEVALCGRTAEAALAGRERLAASLRRQVARGRLEAEREAAILLRVRASILTRDGIAGCAFVIECVPEDRSLKTDVLSRIEGAAPDAIVASNTSGLAIAGLGKTLRAPERFLGLHFFSPAERMPLVEVVKGRETAETTIAAALAFLEAVGKRPVLVRDGPGFFATRVFAAYLDEAVAMVAEGVAPALIEEAALANGRAIGPLATLDETGIGLNLQQARQARADGLEPRFCRPLADSVLARLVESGRGGRRAGGGFYDWSAEGPRTPWPGLAAIFPLAASQPNLETLKLRLLFAEAREALRCLEEGGIASADDADTASVLGLGFPKRGGGVLRWTEDFGLKPFVAACDSLAVVHGVRFAPTSWLRELASQGDGLKAYRRERSSA